MLRTSVTTTTPLGKSSILADRYRIERELGRGGMAVVYLAHDMRHDRQVAVKFIDNALASAVGTQRFLQEIKLTASLHHPHVLSVYDSGVTNSNLLYYVMPFVEGGSLRGVLQARGSLPLHEAVKVAREVADALAFAHERGIVHRDIKPENILFADGHALVADFGIARLVTSTGAEQLTVQGVAVGTPAYMSPEQGFGVTVDARADVYSLACVVYEMLSGRVPFASPAAGTWTEFGFSRMPPPVREAHPEIPEAFEAELIRALAPAPEDRHAGTREFAAALEGLTPPATRPRVSTGRRSRRAWRAGLLAGFAVAVAALAGSAFFAAPLRDQLVVLGMIELDESRVLVAPFQTADSAMVSRATTAERRLREELASWHGVRVMSADATRDAFGVVGEPSLDRAIRAARQSRAGLMMWGRARADSAGVAVETQVFDVRTASVLATIALPARAPDSALSAWAGRTAAVLLGGAELSPAAARAVGGTRSLAAWRAYAHGQRALDEWRLHSADSAFAAAVAADQRFAAARVWLAQTLIWSRRGDRAEWRGHAEESLMLLGSLGPADRAVAQAVAALGRRDEPRACAEYRSLLAGDSLNARAWLGLGDCQAMDEAVVRDARSPSGFAFRASLGSALRAYERAVRVSAGAYAALPSAYLERLLPAQAGRYRRGVNVDDSTRSFAAQPAAAGDSVAYVPRPIVSNTLPPDPPTYEEGLRRNAVRLLEYVTAWTQRAPASVDAYEALAGVQESRGELTGVAAGGRSGALAALDSAQRLAWDAASGARIAASRVRVLIKAGAFEAASTLADSSMSHSGTASAAEAHWLAGIAALTGRAREAARLARVGQTPPVSDWDTLAAPVGQAATLLLVQAASGVCDDAFRGSLGRLEDLIDSYGVPADRAATRSALMDRARRLALPCLGAAQVASIAPRSPWDRMQQSLARGDSAGVRAAFDTLQMSRRLRRPGGTAVDYIFTGAWLLAAVGDTAAAVRYLDLTMNALPTLNRNAVWELAQSAALVRTMVWRADLAHARGDAQYAARWAAAAAVLWRNADAEFKRAVQRMHGIGGSR